MAAGREARSIGATPGDVHSRLPAWGGGDGALRVPTDAGSALWGRLSAAIPDF